MGRRRNPDKVTPYIEEKILAEYLMTGNASFVAKKYNVSSGAVFRIINRNQDDYSEMREQFKKKMVMEIWGGLIEAQKLGQNMITEAIEGKRDIPLNHVSNFFGTLYDKQALLSGENTQNVGGEGIQVVFSMPDVEDEDKWNKTGE